MRLKIYIVLIKVYYYKSFINFLKFCSNKKSVIKYFLIIQLLQKA